MSRLKNLSIVQEILLILLIPLLLLAAFLANNVWDHIKQKEGFDNLAKLAELCNDLGEMIEDVQEERSKSNSFINGTGATLADLQAAFKTTDSVMSRLSLEVEDFKKIYPEHTEEISELFLPLVQYFKQINFLRNGVQDKTLSSREKVVENYKHFINLLINNMTSFPRWVTNGGISRRMLALSHLSNSIGLEGFIRVELTTALNEGKLSLEIYNDLNKYSIESAVHIDVFHDLCIPIVQAEYLKKVKSPAFLEPLKIVERAVAAGPGRELTGLPTSAEWRRVENQRMEILEELRHLGLKELHDTLEHLRSEAKEGIVKNSIILVAVLTLVTGLVIYTTKGIQHRFQVLEQGLANIANGDLTQSIPLDSDNELGRLARFINHKLLKSLTEINFQLISIVSTLKMVVQDLSTSSKEISTTSAQQSAGVKEVVSTMEDTDQLSKQIAQKIGDVSQVVQQSEGEIQKGFNIIQQNQGKMSEIKDGNTQTIDGIKELGQQINSIWDIVNMINGIADQTKIIAFNAELEASSAGEAGKNFQIVATEIRRLADNTVNSTSEIKAKIHEIQKSSDHLVITAESGSSKIEEGWQLSQSLQDVFNTILRGSEVTVKSSGIVSQSVQQQVGAFEQIVLTMKQLAEGISHSSMAVGGTAKISENLQNIANDLDKIVHQYKLPPTGK
ncbi:MAG: methyl-accepting chemotaxis sensory transducer [Chlamydiales bacterium]|jgi:methyl-accepting chemotaxis protein|nr:methyl-accepting chemotaxis sensory transducer [Chlamydiales bacterium]